MHNSQEIATKIKEIARIRKISLKLLLEKCDLNINYISDLAKGKQASALNISKIADVLEVSVDYLLGRTEEPQGKVANSQIDTGDNSRETPKFDKTTNELVMIFERLSFSDKAKVMSLVAELSEKKGA